MTNVVLGVVLLLVAVHTAMALLREQGQCQQLPAPTQLLSDVHSLRTSGHLCWQWDDVIQRSDVRRVIFRAAPKTGTTVMTFMTHDLVKMMADVAGDTIVGAPRGGGEHGVHLLLNHKAKRIEYYERSGGKHSSIPEIRRLSAVRPLGVIMSMR